MHRQCTTSATPVHSQCNNQRRGLPLMEPVHGWTGRTACALQAALRLTNEAFAGQLGVAVRTVATWHQRPDMSPKAEIQLALDTALDRASEQARTRFARLVAGHSPPPADAPTAALTLRVAIAVVVNEAEVLVVCRRGDDGG